MGINERAGISGSSPRLTEQDYQDFFENGALALHLVGRDGTIVGANRAELELLGFTHEEYVGRPISEFHADQATITEILDRLSAGEKIARFPARLLAKDGSVKHVEITSSGRFEGNEFAHTRCFTTDVTEVVEARRQLARQQDEMRQILEALPAAVYTTDAAGKITYFNRAAADLAGREPVIGEDEWCVTFRLFTADGQPLPHAECPMAIALKENRPVRGVEAMAARPDGSMFPFLPYPTPMRDEAGNLVGAINMLIDITDRKSSEARQRVLLDELNHRVKNNMAMLYGLLRGAQRETECVEAKAVLADAGQRIGAMAAAQQAMYQKQDDAGTDAPGFIGAVCASASQVLPKDAELHIDVPSDQVRNEIAMPVALILNELLTNAARHGRDALNRCKVWVSFKRSGRNFELTVRDSGPGYEYRETGRRSSGTGLVAGLVRQLRGSFSVAPGPGAVSTVVFAAQAGD